ncbi:hypothetical protein [Sporolactobacillus pectinivorans]|uniref:hypothetical protein n=1 Tax=Sporolactobacillus pectinivorans TaxID=1591408 RepID=UPI000C261011|nr:hypothetical protein [Sporolactobacillus pectinivorans]
MNRIIVFGGLSAYGFSLSEALMERGNTVITLSSALNLAEKAKEEERRLFLGRNALFQTGAASVSCEAFFLVDTFRARDSEKQQMKSKLSRLSNSAAWASARLAVLLSTLEIYGAGSGRFPETAAVCPETEVGKMALETEHCFSSKCVKRPGIRAAIFRTDISRLKARRAREAVLMAELATAPFEGLEIFNFYADAQPGDKCNQKLSHLMHEKFSWL